MLFISVPTAKVHVRSILTKLTLESTHGRRRLRDPQRSRLIPRTTPKGVVPKRSQLRLRVDVALLLQSQDVPMVDDGFGHLKKEY